MSAALAPAHEGGIVEAILAARDRATELGDELGN